MQKARGLLSSSFGSALIGGLVVAVAGLVMIETGLIDPGDEAGGTTVASAPLTKPASSGKGLTVNQIYERDAPGVAFIEAEVNQQVQSPLDAAPQQQRGTATGSGFVIDGSGHILTNAHVVEGAGQISVSVGEKKVPAELVGTDPSTDVALIKVDPSKVDMKPLEFGDSSAVVVGDPVVAIGNPFGLDRTVTTGIVSALQREIRSPNGFTISDVIQTDAAINPGNSGGPLIDGGGRVIGINSQIASQSGGSEGIGFAVPIATAKEVADQLLEGGSVERAYLGVTGGDVTPEIAKALDLPVNRGAIVSEVFSGGPADRAGLRGSTGQGTVNGEAFPVGGDVIIAIDGKAVSSFSQVASSVASNQPGEKITLTVVRGSRRERISVTLGNRPQSIQDSNAQP